MFRRFSALWISVLVIVSAAAIARAADAPTIVLPGQGTYAQAPNPYPAGTMAAVLAGDPMKAGSMYTVRLKLPANAKIPPHTHGDTENVTVISGTLMVGLGKTFDASKMMPLPAGSFVSIPANTPHFAMAKDDVVLQVSGMGPGSMTLVQ
jgi:quercetin dioxygenase-like cupin family protein